MFFSHSPGFSRVACRYGSGDDRIRLMFKQRRFWVAATVIALLVVAATVYGWRAAQNHSSNAALAYYRDRTRRLQNHLQSIAVDTRLTNATVSTWENAVTGAIQDCQSITNGPDMTAGSTTGQKQAADNLHKICQDLTPLALHSRQILIALEPLSSDDSAAAAAALQSVPSSSADPAQTELTSLLEHPPTGRPVLATALSYQAAFWQQQVQLNNLQARVAAQEALLNPSARQQVQRAALPQSGSAKNLPPR